VEEHGKIIEGLMSRQGYTEEEAEVAYHLEQAEDRLVALYRRTVGREAARSPTNTMNILQSSLMEPHFRALYTLLDRRVLRRSYPESRWRPGDPRGESPPGYD
jgi:hypothetical protein